MAQLSRATVDAVEGNAVVIGVIDSLQESLLRDRIAILEAAIADVLLVPLRVIVKGRPAVSATPMRTSAQRAKPAASAGEAGGEIDLMAYARERIGGSENS
jgi:hypothetical protein